MTTKDFSNIRKHLKQINQLEEVINEYKALEVELGLNLDTQIEQMQEELDELKRGLNKCLTM